MHLLLTQCFPPAVGGIEGYMGGLARALAASGRRVMVFADGYAPPDPTLADIGLRRFDGWKFLRRRRKAAAAKHFLRRNAECCVIADSWKSLELVPLEEINAARATVLCLAHGMEFPSAPSGKKARRITESLGRAHRVLANSHFTAEQARKFAPPSVEITVAPPPIDPQPEAQEVVMQALRTRLAMPDEAPLIVFLGRLEERKGADRAISALARISQRDARLAIAGSGPDQERLEKLARKNNLQDRVSFLGRVDDAEKAALLQMADVFCMPSRRVGDSVEGFGIVYLEAGWYGTPSIAGREGGAADAVIDGETGLLCDGAKLPEVTQALENMLADQALRARLGAGAAEHARALLWSARISAYAP